MMLYGIKCLKYYSLELLSYYYILDLNHYILYSGVEGSNLALAKWISGVGTALNKEGFMCRHTKAGVPRGMHL